MYRPHSHAHTSYLNLRPEDASSQAPQPNSFPDTMLVPDPPAHAPRDGSPSLMPLALCLKAGVATRQLQSTQEELASAPDLVSPAPLLEWPPTRAMRGQQGGDGGARGGGGQQSPLPPPPLAQHPSPDFERRSETSARLWDIPSPFDGGVDVESVFGE
jgi:hypothetical protein